MKHVTNLKHCTYFQTGC